MSAYKIFDNRLFENDSRLFANLELFIKRFPELSQTMNLNKDTVKALLKKIPASYKLEESKVSVGDGAVLTANVNGKYIHSKYNPIREAEKNLEGDFFKTGDVKSACVFFGLGLGYLPELYIKKNKNANLIIVEPDIFIFLFFLSSRDLSDFFKHKNLSMLLGVYPNEVMDFFSATKQENLPIFKQPSLIAVSSAWFNELEVLKKRREEKDKLNKNTLKKFGKIWLKNLLKNIEQIEKLNGIIEFENLFKNYKALVIAAGPSLNAHLKIIKPFVNSFVLIVTDTAVRACLREGITPDFILLMDSQYWNYLHLSDLNIKDSILVTETSVYPAVFRIKTRATLLCASSFPLSIYIEELIGNKGKLVTGGSVATAAWDFARVLGCTEIIMAGLDLAFPNFQTHFFGSRFEENSNSNSSRFTPTETSSHRSLYSAVPEIADGYKNSVLTDKRMKMYAWWFESKLEEFKTIKTYNLDPQGLKIPNMPAISKAEFFKKAENSRLSENLKDEIINRKFLELKNKNLEAKKHKPKTYKGKNLKEAFEDLRKDLMIWS